MDLATLEIFRVVADEGSVTRAARRLGRVQSNVTTRVQQLEEELGASLFARDGKGMALTPAGERFLDHAQRLLALAQEARQVLHPHTPQGSLRVGSMESTAASRLPGPLAAYRRRWPQVTLRLRTAPSRQLTQAVQDRELDCALLALPQAAGPDVSPQLTALGLEGVVVCRESLVLLLPPEHPPVASLADVQIRTLVAFEPGCSYRLLAEDGLAALAGTGVPRLPVALDIHEVGSYHAMLACVAAGGCAGVLPRSLLELLREPPDLREVPLAEVDTLLVWRAGYATPALAALREALSEALSDLAGPAKHLSQAVAKPRRGRAG